MAEINGESSPAIGKNKKKKRVLNRWPDNHEENNFCLFSYLFEIPSHEMIANRWVNKCIFDIYIKNIFHSNLSQKNKVREKRKYLNILSKKTF